MELDIPYNRNQYGLTRTIPEDIKRQVRQACGFGCVCCGLAIATYEHIDPEFHFAESHDPDKMAYLCGASMAINTASASLIQSMTIDAGDASLEPVLASTKLRLLTLTTPKAKPTLVGLVAQSIPTTLIFILLRVS